MYLGTNLLPRINDIQPLLFRFKMMQNNASSSEVSVFVGKREKYSFHAFNNADFCIYSTIVLMTYYLV